MDQTVQIKLNNDLKNFNIENTQNSTYKTDQKCSELTKILIGLAILVIIIAFIFFYALLF